MVLILNGRVEPHGKLGLRSEAANAAEEVLVLLMLIKVRFLSPPYSNC